MKKISFLFVIFLVSACAEEPKRKSGIIHEVVVTKPIVANYTCKNPDGDEPMIVETKFYKRNDTSLCGFNCLVIYQLKNPLIGKYEIGEARQAVSASGARYLGDGIEFWDKGGRATLTTPDMSVECVKD